ncbi:MAG: four helix bundle protein [Bacteroidales bacterium]|nr:four helix bundle protein [Bacteroidales bacterium]MCF8387176.1 four helix bundle protein [Bacteroidales bacterium]MCF8397668.1 four helix bundle protein [Bacteroidales bacterium]
MKNPVKYDLEERLIDFSVQIVKIVEKVVKTKAGNLLTTQLIKAGTSPALNYGEAQSSESRKDFIHKMRIALKELRETNVCLRIIRKGKLINDLLLIDKILKENNELIAIFVKSIDTAGKGLDKVG